MRIRQHPGSECRLVIEQSYRQLHRELVWYFRRNGESIEDARDLAQESLVEAFQNADKFRGDAKIRTWIRSIGKNRWLHHCRKRDALKRNPQGVRTAGAEDPSPRPWDKKDVPTADSEKEEVDRDLLRRTMKAMRNLPQTLREPLLLHANGHKYQEIADLLQISENRVSSLIHQARKKLRREILGAPADAGVLR